jgi:ABC-type oligopeptide transport system ATPase subunit
MIEISHVTKTFRGFGRPTVTALDDVCVRIPDRATVGLVGESGSGKSTLLRCLMRLDDIDSGSITLGDEEVTRLRGRALTDYRRRVQMVFQDPTGSLNPRMTVAECIEEGMIVHHRSGGGAARASRVGELLELVGLNPDHRGRHPGSFSGGQKQRIAIARALAVEPEVLVCDEPVSALDVSVQAQVLNLLRDMADELGLSIFFVAHDLAVVRYLCPDIYVMHSGRIVEHADRATLFATPADAYTRALIDAVPSDDALRASADYLVPPEDALSVR